MIRNLLLIVAVTLSCIDICAQDLRVQQKKLDRLQNIPASHIYRVMQDSEGYIWYASHHAGLCRDNGYQIDLFRSDRNNPDIIANNDVFCMAELTGNRILFGTRYGAYFLDKDDYSISPLNEEFRGDVSVPNILVDKNNTVWIAHGTQVSNYTQDGQLTHRYDITCHGCPTRVKDIFVDSKNTVWVMHENGGIGHISGGSYMENRWFFAPVECMIELAYGSYLVGTRGSGLIGYNGIFGHRIEEVADNDIISILRDMNREVLWMTTRKGLRAFSVHGQQLSPLPLERFESKDNLLLNNLCQDRQGNIWVAGYTPHTFVISDIPSDIQRDYIDGYQQIIGANSKIERILYCPPILWLYERQTGLSAYNYFNGNMLTLSDVGFTNVMAKSNDGAIWATDSRTIYKVRKGWQEGYSIEPLPVDSFSRNIEYLGQYDNLLYVGTDSALYSIDIKTNALKTIYCPPCGFGVIGNVVPLENGWLFALSRHNGAVLLKNGKNIQIPIVQHTRRTSPILDTKRHRLWVIDHNGDLASIYLSTLDSISDGKLKYDDNLGSILHVENDAVSREGDPIRQILLDKGDHIWILYDKYVTEYNPETHFLRTLYGHDPNINMDNFQWCCETGDGISVCGSNGICYIKHSTTIDSPQSNVQAKVSTYVANGKKYFVGVDEKEIRISPDITSLILHLTSNDKTNTSNITFAYRVKEVSDNWTYLPEGRNTLSLLNLQKGTYTLQVKVTDSSRTWNLPVDCITIIRTPAWWESWWAQTLYVLLILLLIFGIIRFYKVMQRRRERFYHLVALLHSRELYSKEGDAVSSDAAGGEKLQSEENDKEQLSLYEQDILKQAINCIEKNLSNQEYSIDNFSADMCMSRVNLYRKMLSITGQTPTDFIKGYRLTKAAELVLSGRYSLVVISEMTGFSSPSYFRKCFKEKYGVLPSNYKG